MKKVYKNKDLMIILEAKPSIRIAEEAYEVDEIDKSSYDFKVYNDTRIIYNAQREYNESDLIMSGSINYDGCCNFTFEDERQHSCDVLVLYVRRLKWISNMLQKIKIIINK